MSILRILDFQKVYPRLWNNINEIRIQTGSNTLDKDYSEYFAIPIRMYDASLAESFLEKKDKIDLYNPKEVLGYSNLQKIINAVTSEPNMLRWLDILYYPNNPKGLYSDRYNIELKIKKPKKQIIKEPAMANVRNKVEGELIVNVSKNADGTFTALDEAGSSYDINQKKLKYAFENKGVVRGRKNASGEIVWRVVKEKYVTPKVVLPEPTDSAYIQAVKD